jgi:hypothetical protein
VIIDIKPGSLPNSINPNSHGVIPVAILTLASFDATTVDQNDLAFGPAQAAPRKCAIDDVDGDGDQDLMCHFRTQETGISAGDVEACVTGQTLGGEPITGCDSVRTVPPNADADGDSLGLAHLTGDDVEASVGTDQLRGCSVPGIDAWPPDINGDNQVTLSDLMPYQQKMTATLGDAGYESRLDMAFDGTLDIRDAIVMAAFYGIGCSEANPDADGDAFLNLEELSVGTDALDDCPDDPTDDAWPADLTSVDGPGLHDGTINILDVVQLTPPFFGSKRHQKNYSERKDFNADGKLDILDIVRVTPPAYGSSCTP